MTKSVFLAGLLAIVAWGVAAADQPDAAAILDAAIKAHGGEAALGKIVGFYVKLKISPVQSAQSDTWYYEEWFERDKERDLSFDKSLVPLNTEVVNGNDGWSQDWGQPTDTMNADTLSSRQEGIHENFVTTNLVALKGKEYKLSILPEIEIGGRKANGILVECEKRVPLKFYFDKETHLLAELRNKIKDVEPDKTTDHDQQCIYSDYRDVQGTRQPFKMEVLWDGAKTSDMFASQQKISEKPFDKRLFEKP
jgi:3',5'-cyclic AMP phosphodiesterase CpdA